MSLDLNLQPNFRHQSQPIKKREQQFFPTLEAITSRQATFLIDAVMDESSKEKRNKKRKTGKNNATENEEVKVVEEESPSFASFRLDPRLLKAISDNFEKPTLVQSAAIPLALNGRDIVARAKTGSGKTAAYVIPIIHQILTKSVCSSARRN